MKKLFLLPLIIAMSATLLLAACTDSGAARRALEAQGFTDIEITGYAPFSCSEDDATSTGFTATNPQGKRVSGVACGGLLFKNTTIRW